MDCWRYIYIESIDIETKFIRLNVFMCKVSVYLFRLLLNKCRHTDKNGTEGHRETSRVM